jgi:short-subunit dehydrogenase
LDESIGRGQFDISRKTIEVNLIGAMATVDAAVSYFLERGSGHIVGTSSVQAFRGMSRNGSYGASKAGLANYLEALRGEVYGENIDVTILYPGFIDTPMTADVPSVPFMISVEKAAVIIARMIEKKVKSRCVPVIPWAIIGRLLRILPLSVISKL